jgi:hypothetical protein
VLVPAAAAVAVLLVPAAAAAAATAAAALLVPARDLERPLAAGCNTKGTSPSQLDVSAIAGQWSGYTVSLHHKQTCSHTESAQTLAKATPPHSLAAHALGEHHSTVTS